MTQIDRRSFITGVIAAIASAAPIPFVSDRQTVETLAAEAQWVKDILVEIAKYGDDLKYFGTAALQSIDRYPYIRAIRPEEIFIDGTMRAPDDMLLLRSEVKIPALEPLHRAVSDMLFQPNEFNPFDADGKFLAD